jgi:flagellin
MSALTEMKSLAAAIAAGGTTAAYEADYTALSTEITSAIAAGVFDGSTAMTAPATALAVAGSATTANVQAVIDGWAGILQGVGTSAKSYERQITFNSKLQDALEAGAGNLVDADLAKESARLTALQTKQQLGVQALSIANSASSTLLGLFR